MNPVSKYYKLRPNAICEDINESTQEVIHAEAEKIQFVVFPHVYPSHKFRTTSFLLRNLKKLVKNRKICDMGCGPGIIGLYSLHHGARHVVQVDINQFAIENAKENNILHGFGNDRILTVLSNCFDNVERQLFDLIIWNIPFHSQKTKITDLLQFAFFDPEFYSLKRFLIQAKEFMHKKTQIYIAFSNKGRINILENLFEQNGYKWELWKITNTEQMYDNRIYRLRLPERHFRRDVE